MKSSQNSFRQEDFNNRNSKKQMTNGFVSSLILSNHNKELELKKYNKIKENFNSDLKNATDFINTMHQKKNKDKEAFRQIDDKSRLKLNQVLQNEQDIRVIQSLEKKHEQHSYSNPINFIEKKQHKIIKNQTPQPLQKVSGKYTFINAQTPKNFTNEISNEFLSKQKVLSNDQQEVNVELQKPKILKKATTLFDPESLQIMNMMKGSEREVKKFEMRMEEITNRLSSMYTYNAHEILKPVQEKFEKKYSDFDQECTILLNEFKDLSANPLLLNWREDQNFFHSNFLKLQNIKEFVDVYESSKERQSKENENKSNMTRLSQIIQENIDELDPETKMLDESAPEFQKHQAQWKAKKRRFFPVYKKMNDNDNYMATLSVQKQDQEFQNKLSDKVKANNPDFKVVYPDISFEKYNIWRWWEQEINDQVKLQESKYLLLHEFKTHLGSSKNQVSNNMNVANTFRKFCEQHKYQTKMSVDKEIIF